MAPSLRFALVLAPLLAPAAFATTWTVDDDGPAQFTTVDAAHAVAQFDDVILVAPGTYPAFHLTKSVKVLGPADGARPHFTGTSTATGQTRFTLAGLSLEVLHVSDVNERAVIDDCALAANNHAAVLKITNCQHAFVSRCSITGTQGYGGIEPAVVATDAWLSWTDNDVVGGNAYHGDSAWGQTAMKLKYCLAWITGSSASGGAGGGPWGGCASCSGGSGGDGLDLEWASVRIRGSSQDGCYGGPGVAGGSSGRGIRAREGSTVAWSGITPPTLSIHTGAVVVHPASPAPAMTIGGSDVAGETRRVLLRGPQGAPAVLGMAISGGSLSLGGFEGFFWIGPNNLIASYPIVLKGQEEPAVKSFTLPPLAGLEGLTVWFQAAFPTLPGEFYPELMTLGNASNIVLRH